MCARRGLDRDENAGMTVRNVAWGLILACLHVLFVMLNMCHFGVMSGEWESEERRLRKELCARRGLDEREMQACQ